MGRVRTVPLCDIYPGIYITTEKKSTENFGQGRELVLSVSHITINDNKN
jgi:hypothetical protein